MDSSSKQNVNLTPRECEILVGAWLSLKDPQPQLDYENFANFLGLQKAKSARNAFGVLKKRLQEEFGNGVSGNSVNNKVVTTKKTSTKSTTTKKKASEMLGDDTGGDQVDTNPFQPAAKKAKQDNYDPGHSELEEGYIFEDGRI
ncbi:hypothetical protein MCOR25_004446 [Pyricularia grisea]|nr:hypothetical protein MCOR25_004446 [Pyricularia grisea]